MPKNVWVANPAMGNGFVMATAYPEETKHTTKYVRADLTGLQCFYDYKGELPEKFIALFGDGSGCDLYHKQDNGLWRTIDTIDVDKDWFADAGYLWFIALPDDFKVWGKNDQN